MPDKLDFTLTGASEVTAKLREVQKDVRLKGGRFALRKAANLVRDAAKASADAIDRPETEQHIAANVVVRFSPRDFRRNGNLVFRVGILGGARSQSKSARSSARRRRRQGTASLESLGEVAGAGKGNPGGDTFYWRFQEFGTEDIAGKHFMENALRLNVNNAQNTFVRQYGKALDRAIRRAERQARKS